MNIVQYCEYQFPAKGSAGSERIVERLCRGLTKLGHKVYLYCKPGSITDTGAIVVHDIPDDTDIVHHHGFMVEREHEYALWKKPWVSTIHGGGVENDPTFLNRVKDHPNIICVSKFVADRLGCKAFVHSCASPEELEFENNKENYFLYLAGFGWGAHKGLDIFLQLADKFWKHGFYVCGAGGDPNFVRQIQFVCGTKPNVKFIGEVNGQIKSDYLKKAKALIYPTKLPDASPASVVEALMCGTPVIGSSNGAMPEMVPNGTGFICNSLSDYMKAIININKIDPKYCRSYAEQNYSDLFAAQKHLQYYQNVINNGRVA